MNIDYLIQLLTNRLAGLALAKDQAFQSGELERIVSVDAEILDVQNTISKLKLLASIEQTAAATPFTVSEVVKNGIEASFNPTVINDFTQPLLDFDITPYATDPYHEIKIQNILEKMGPMDTGVQIEAYIKKANPDSPLTGDMVHQACAKYNVSTRLALALMELDSRFGTVGLAVSTRNPGNVGNDGVNIRTYASWNDGVEAVAEWLSRHRITKAATVQETVVTPVVPTSTPEVVAPVVPLVTEPAPAPAAPTYVQTPISTPEPTPAPAPVVETPAPTPVVENPTPAPVVETPTPTPVTETPAPVVAPTPEPTPAPVTETPAPVVAPTPEPTPAPVVETPAPTPVVETPAPVVETPTPTPVVETPAPAPVVETPAPAPTPEPTASLSSARGPKRKK